MNSPRDILNYVYENHFEMDFMSAIMAQKQNFSIAEITDKVFKKQEGKCRLFSKAYNINLEITDDEIVTAVHNDLYVSAFISRKGDKFNVHFLVHRYPTSMKAQFDEQILNEVIQYMIYNTIIALRLDTPAKVDEYIK